MDPFKPRAIREAVDAPTIALRAVAYIAGDEGLLNRFIALTGCDGDSLGQRLNDPAFLGAVLDFLLHNEPDLLAFCEASELSPDMVVTGRTQLS